MEPELKTKWIEALRSGKYMQGKGYLRTKDDRFCCLGVLCDLVDSDRWKPSRISAGPERYDFDETSRYLPDAISWLHPMSGTLIEMNDEGKTFAQIADYIEKAL